MRIRSRAMTVLAAAVLTGGGLTAVTSTPASAATCYGSAKTYYTNDSWEWPVGGTYATATSNCTDINVKPTDRDMLVQTCFLKTGTCNGWHSLKKGTWGVAATNVLSGTKFYLDFWGYSEGYVAY
ncbi:hypothetical protein ACIP6V_23860 [Streptomyces sp. NPDC088770]|uniref:hypothetical protein n=1 Tax=unclassified Streptomyces TaxID=2593676 RepID=UPI002DD988F2|nr:hypothetical protein [Streptomyces sp. NBC_01788]WSB29713.1 hypothetical protein OIE49_29620 [Streptomyces sp. NBC_01788]